MHDHVWFDFTRWGYEGWLPISCHELEILWLGMEDLLQDRSPEAIQAMLACTHSQLRQQARSGRITSEWVTTAAMLMAVEGHQGLPLPPYRLQPV